MKAAAVHPEQLALQPQRRAYGRVALAELDLRHADQVLAAEQAELEQLPQATTCRCRPAPWLADPTWCLRCGHRYSLSSSPAAADGVEVGAPARLQPPGA